MFVDVPNKRKLYKTRRLLLTYVITLDRYNVPIFLQLFGINVKSFNVKEHNADDVEIANPVSLLFQFLCSL